MNIGSKEHFEILEQFEKNFKDYGLDREGGKHMWRKGQIYQSGETNALYKAYIMGYSFGRCQYLRGDGEG